jgi:hypothetical protein
VALDSDGDFVVAWNSNLQDGSFNGIFARRFTSAGTALATELQINSYTTAAQSNPAVGINPNGDFVIAWQSNGQDGNFYGVFGRRFSSAGTALATEFQVQSYTTGHQAFPSVAMTAGRFVIAWHSNLQDGSSYGVFAQRFSALALLDIDGNGALSALADGLLALRYLFTFTGDTLITGAIGPNCTRCDAAAILTYLDAIKPQLDIDGNGAFAALTDGLLILRYLFSFRGATLITGAVDTGGCTRCTAPTIEGYLAGLV